MSALPSDPGTAQAVAPMSAAEHDLLVATSRALGAWMACADERERMSELPMDVADWSHYFELQSAALQAEKESIQAYHVVFDAPDPEKYDTAVHILASCSQDSIPATVDDNGHLSG